MATTTNKTYITLKGTLLYPKTLEQGGKSFALAIDNKTDIKKLATCCKEEYSDYAPISLKANDEYENMVNFKTKYEMKVFGVDDEPTSYEHGAKVIVKLVIVPIKYMGKKMLTMYANAMCVISHGEEQKKTSAKDLLAEYGEDLPF